MSDITSIHNPRIKQATRLRERKHRDDFGLFLIDGLRESLRAIQSGIEIREAFLCREWIDDEATGDWLQQIEARVPITWVNAPVFEKLAYGDRADGIVLVGVIPSTELAGLRLPDSPLIGIVEAVEKPGNLGAILRTADGAGLSAVIAASARTDFHNPNVIRASQGTVFSQPIAAASADEVITWLREHRFRIYASRVDGAMAYTDVDYAGPVALVLGSEAMGLSSTWSGVDVTPIFIPMHGSGDSLNVSATAAVLFYEARRQREFLSSTAGQRR